jgi:hypothetical protein
MWLTGGDCRGMPAATANALAVLAMAAGAGAATPAGFSAGGRPTAAAGGGGGCSLVRLGLLLRPWLWLASRLLLAWPWLLRLWELLELAGARSRADAEGGRVTDSEDDRRLLLLLLLLMPLENGLLRPLVLVAGEPGADRLPLRPALPAALLWPPHRGVPLARASASSASSLRAAALTSSIRLRCDASGACAGLLVGWALDERIWPSRPPALPLPR